MNARYTFDYAFRVLLAILPFMTILSIFTREKLGIPWFSFLKEALLLVMLLTIVWYHVKWIRRIQLTRIDLLFWSWQVEHTHYEIHTFPNITFENLFWIIISGILFGWRYDFSFLLAFFIVYHWVGFLEKTKAYYIKIFIVSGGIMLAISMLLKWPLSEDLLLYFGYSWNPSNWQFGSSIPIFHGVDGANVRRFQGLLDGPNTMWAFLLMYMGVFTYYFRHFQKWHFFIGCVLSIMLMLIIYTYSRSALLWFFAWVWFIILFLLPKIYKKYKIEFISILIFVTILLWAFFIQYSGTMKALLGRAWSTSGHLERMKIWISRFIENPMWQWLGSAGPAYRHVQNLENKDRKEVEEIDKKFIPESWYIQQLVEWWFLWLLLFLVIIGSMFRDLMKKNIILAGTFLAILTMNFFLHTFESAIVSLLLFSLIALIVAPHEKS